MRLIPILFSTPMLQALLKGRKTQTRRGTKLPDTTWDFTGMFVAEDGNLYAGFIKDNVHLQVKSPYGKVGDILWVREKFSKNPFYREIEAMSKYLYAASDKPMEPHKWKPSIHMPYEACRIWLKITGIRVERLQEISEEDAEAEGVSPYHNYDGTHGGWGAPSNYKEAFYCLWQSINGEESWNSNPWVWTINFARTNKPKKV